MAEHARAIANVVVGVELAHVEHVLEEELRVARVGHQKLRGEIENLNLYAGILQQTHIANRP